MKQNITTIQKLTFHLCLFTFVVLFFASCTPTEPPKPKPEKPKLIELKEITKSCTEIFIKVSTKDTLLPANVVLQRDGKEIKSFYQTKNDTTIIDTGLAVEEAYTYQAILKNKGEEGKSKEIKISTLPTTSSNFTWKTYTFGEHSGSIINDVAIINENDIWAVGEIYMNDSTGKPDAHAYNAVHWDGQKWELKRIFYYGNCSAVKYPSLYAILGLSKNNIIITNGGSIGWYDGENVKLDCRVNSLLKGAIVKIWGNSNNDLYVVGRNGSIVHYKDTSWEKIESGTTTNINDIWGVNDSTGGNSLILTTVSSRYHIGDYKLLSISGNIAEEYFYWPYTRLYGIWFNSPQKIYIVGDGGYLYVNNKLSRINLPTNFFLTGVKGNGLNDIYMAGSDARIYHFNGIDWKEINNGIYGSYEGMDVKGNTVAFVGYNIEGGIVGKAVVTIGKHYK